MKIGRSCSFPVGKFEVALMNHISSLTVALSSRTAADSTSYQTIPLAHIESLSWLVESLGFRGAPTAATPFR